MVRGVTAQVETLLRKYEPGNDRQGVPPPASTNMTVDSNEIPSGLIATYDTSSFSPPSRHCMSDDPQTQVDPNASEISNEKKSNGLNDSFSWEMVELGLEEPLPLQEILEDL